MPWPHSSVMAAATPARGPMVNSAVTRRWKLSSLAVIGRVPLMAGGPSSWSARFAAQSEPVAEGSLKGKTVLITGSTDGLGREVARRAAALGAHVVVHGRNRERGAAVVDDAGAAEQPARAA